MKIKQKKDKSSNKYINVYDGEYDPEYLTSNNIMIIEWPQSQRLENKEGFENNSALIDDDFGLLCYGGGSYAVDKKWYKKTFKRN